MSGDLPSLLAQAQAEAERQGSAGVKGEYDHATKTGTVQADLEASGGGWWAKFYAKYIAKPGPDDATVGVEVRKRWFGSWGP